VLRGDTLKDMTSEAEHSAVRSGLQVKLPPPRPQAAQSDDRPMTRMRNEAGKLAASSVLSDNIAKRSSNVCFD
jgi:hypothetical protein